MLYDIKKEILDTEEFEFIQIEEREYYWKGIFWLFGYRQGRESVYAFDQLYKKSRKEAYGKMFGAFSMIIKENDTISLFADNSNMNTFFISERYISHSFLENVKKQERLTYNKKAIVEYLETGSTYHNTTIYNEITQLNTDDIIVIEHGNIIKKKKNIKDIDAAGEVISPEEFFKHMAYALEGKQVALSLTGGYDSRLVFAALYKALKIDTVLSGNNIENKEFSIARKLSSIAGVEHKDIIIDKPKISQQEVWDMFQKADGLLFEMQDGDIRLSKYKDELERLKYDVLITGDTGTYHKDWYWLTDFPFYHKKNFSVSKYIKQRLCVINKNIPYGQELQKEYSEFFTNTKKDLESIRKDINTRSYDMFSWKYKYVTNCRYNHMCNGYQCQIYSPLNERELIRYSYALPRRKRFFNNEMRRLTTKFSPEIARISTNYGTNESSEILYVIKDIFIQFVDYIKKAIRLLGRKVLKKTFFVTYPTTWSCKADIANLKLAEEAVNWAKENNWLTQESNLSKIDFSSLGKIMRMYMLANEKGEQG